MAQSNLKKCVVFFPLEVAEGEGETIQTKTVLNITPLQQYSIVCARVCEYAWFSGGPCSL